VWKKKAEEFYLLWQFPSCIGAVDGKQIEIQTPYKIGSIFFNYKNIFTLLLFTLVDASYKFTIIDVSGHGKSSDGGIFTRSILRKSLEVNTLNISDSKSPPKSEESLPFVIMGDEALHVKKYLLRPYPVVSALNDGSKQIYN
jgi:hypothetical protein